MDRKCEPELSLPDRAPAVGVRGGGRGGLQYVGMSVAGLVGVYGWLVFLMAFNHDGAIGPRYNAPGVDYMVYWTAAHAAIQGNFYLLADPAAFTDHINVQFQHWLARPLPLFPWLYPPHFLLILLPFAALPFAVSYVLFQIVTFVAAVAAGCYFWAGTAARRMLWLFALALAPATSVNAIAGQNALLTLALMLTGGGLLGRRDFVAGAVLGLLSYKPQFAILVPVALLAVRNWRALGGVALSALVAIAVSAATFGVVPWWDWLNHVLPAGLTSAPTDASWSQAGRLWGLSIWAWVTLLGAPGWAANAAQGVAAAVAAGCVWSVFRRQVTRNRRMAVLLTATLIAAPHSSSYDLVLLAAAVLLLYQDILDGFMVMVNPSLLLLPWAAPLVLGPRSSPLGFAVPVIVLWQLLILMRSPPNKDPYLRGLAEQKSLTE